MSKIHDNSIWLEKGPEKITKNIVHRVTGYPTLDHPMTMRSEVKDVIERNTGDVWNKQGMTIDTITDPLIVFSIRIIVH